MITIKTDEITTITEEINGITYSFKGATINIDNDGNVNVNCGPAVEPPPLILPDFTKEQYESLEKIWNKIVTGPIDFTPPKIHWASVTRISDIDSIEIPPSVQEFAKISYLPSTVTDSTTIEQAEKSEKKPSSEPMIPEQVRVWEHSNIDKTKCFRKERKIHLPPNILPDPCRGGCDEPFEAKGYVWRDKKSKIILGPKLEVKR